jgi:lipopolysaccharide/colanic/teichoic acid biosynthesis glycosyltransferase/glycosyltransferase involved in cell wall biosynthesis
MVLRKWNTLPPYMKNPSVAKYYNKLQKKRVQLILKRAFDMIAAMIAFMIMCPIIIFISILIKLDSKGPVLFRQLRVTRYGKLFRIYKFRTMKVDTKPNDAQVTLKDDERITRVGKTLRKYRLDELPQLLNIIIGTMTFVGPRPEVVKYVKQYNEEMMATLLLPAGVTSEASIQFKDESDYLEKAENADATYTNVILPQKMKINLESIEKFSLMNDCKILLGTLGAVMGKQGTDPMNINFVNEEKNRNNIDNERLDMKNRKDKKIISNQKIVMNKMIVPNIKKVTDKNIDNKIPPSIKKVTGKIVPNIKNTTKIKNVTNMAQKIAKDKKIVKDKKIAKDKKNLLDLKNKTNKKIMKEKKLIALLTNNDDDVYCFRKELIERLIAEGYKVLVSCPYGKKLDLMKDISFIHEDVSIDRRGTNIIKDCKLLSHYLKLLKLHKPDVVLTYTVKPNIYGSMAAMLRNIPYINNVTGLGSIVNKHFLMQDFILRLYRYAFRKSQCIFFQNAENLKLAKKQRLIKGNYKLIPGSGVNTERFSLQPYPPDSNGIVFNYIGRILKEKGIDDYLEAAKRIKRKYKNTEFNILGFIEPTEHHYEGKIMRLQRQGIVKYRGNQADIRPFINRAHAIIHPSQYGEGMSNVLLENASSGRPAITTDIAGCREIINKDVTGYLYPAGNVDELVRTIEKFLSLDHLAKANMGIEARKKVVKEFSREKVIEAYVKEVNKICQNT